MKFWTKKSNVQKIIVSLLLVVVVNFISPIYSYGSAWGDIGSALIKELMELFVAVGDVVTGGLNKFMLGADEIPIRSSILDQDDINVTNPSTGSWLYAGDKTPTITIPTKDLDPGGFFGTGDLEIPNMLYSPENIFANNIGMLDVNFLSPNKYTSVTTGQTVEYDPNTDVKDQDQQISAASILSSTVATWYRSFRNIAIVGLLSVLVYLGIRILLSSTSAEKAKYKENIKDWFIALCLVFLIHFIMSGILMLTEQVNSLFGESVNNIVVEVSGENLKFNTNLMGLARFYAQSESPYDATAYTLIYLILVGYTIAFTWQYLKRFLYMAFFTMIAPLVALTYPIDRAGDSKAQAFNYWFKEYTMNAIIQPIHLILYTALVGSAIELATKNPIYGIVAIGFMMPAEKIIKKMFGVNSETESGMGGFVGGALAMTGLQKLAGGSKAKASGSGAKDDGSSKIKFAKQSNAGDLDSFGSSLSGSTPRSSLPVGGNIEPEGESNNGEPTATPQGSISPSSLINPSGPQGQNIADNVTPSGWGIGSSGISLPPSAIQPTSSQGASTPQTPTTPQTDDGEHNWNTNFGRMFSSYPGAPHRITAGEVAGNVKRKIKKPTARSIGKAAWKGVKLTARAGRYVAPVAGAIAGASFGVISAATTGDVTKAFSRAAAVAGIGGILGRKAYGLGESAVDAVSNRIPQKFNDIQYKKDNFLYGASEAKRMDTERKNERARKEFLNNKEEIKKYRDMKRSIGYSGKVEDLMKAAADYKAAGIKDDDMIKNALKTEKRNGEIGGRNHDRMVDIASFANEYGFTQDHLIDEKKRTAMENVVSSKVEDQRQQREVMKLFADMNGLDYERISNRNAQTQQTQQTPQTPRTPRTPPIRTTPPNT